MEERSRFAEAVRFWEPARLAFNVVLALIVIVPAFLSINGSPAQITQYGAALPPLLFLAAVANLLYCAAYPYDLVLQAIAPQRHLKFWRWGAWALGVLFAAAIAGLLTLLFFGAFAFGAPF